MKKEVKFYKEKTKKEKEKKSGVEVHIKKPKIYSPSDSSKNSTAFPLSQSITGRTSKT